MLEPAADELVGPRKRLLDAGGYRPRALRIDTDRGAAARLVERRVIRDHARRPRGHRLDHGHPEALEAGGVDEDRRAAVEVREPRRFEVSEVAERDEPMRQLCAAQRLEVLP